MITIRIIRKIFMNSKIYYKLLLFYHLLQETTSEKKLLSSQCHFSNAFVSSGSTKRRQGSRILVTKMLFLKKNVIIFL